MPNGTTIVSPLTKDKIVNDMEVRNPDIPNDEREVLAVYRRAKSMGYADVSIAIQEGKRVKLWLTEKLR
jgi:hypothetical protein